MKYVSRLRKNRSMPLLVVAAVFGLIGIGLVVHPKAASTPLTWAPPTLTNPTTVNIGDGNTDTTLDPAKDYIVNLPASQKIGSTQLSGGHNIIIKGGWLTITPSSVTDDAHGRALYIKNATGTVHIEGVNIDNADGGQGDAIAINAPLATVQLENIRATDLKGTFASAHADCVQPWGGVKELRIDHFTCTNMYQGFQLNRGTGEIGKVTIKNANLVSLPNTLTSDPSLAGGVMVWLTSGNCTDSFPTELSEVYVVPKAGHTLGYSVWPAAYDLACPAVTAGSQVSWPGLAGQVSGNVKLGAPPGGDFVPAANVGLNYTSPGYKAAAASLPNGCSAADAGCPRSLGVYPGYTFPADIDTYTNLVGKKPAVVEWFQSWLEPLYYTSQKNGIDAQNVTPLITWSPAESQANILDSINSGAQDTYIRQQADLAKAWNRPIMIRLMHEMNGNWQSFGLNVTGNTAPEFVSAWRHVVDIFRQQGATNVSWVWSPNLISNNSPDPSPMYPGNDYVNWTALDGYNNGATSPWKSMGTLFGPTYDIVTALASKPFMIAEWGSTETGGNKAAWITQAFFTDIPTRLPKTRIAISFNRSKDQDWRVNTSPASLAAYQQVVASGSYNPLPESAANSLRGDITGASGDPDGKIDIYDISYLIRHYDTTDNTGDITGASGSPDGRTDLYDLSYAIRNYNE